MLETSEMMADMFREKTGSDIALVLHGVTCRDNVMRIYIGTLINQENKNKCRLFIDFNIVKCYINYIKEERNAKWI